MVIYHPLQRICRKENQCALKKDIQITQEHLTSAFILCVHKSGTTIENMLELSVYTLFK